MIDLEGRVIAIAGAGGGLGPIVAQRLADAGASLSLADRSQEIAERRMAEMGLDRHIVLRSPHFMSVPHLVATSNIISIVPRAVGRAFMHTGRLKLLEPPFKIPSIELKQFWHRRVHTDPGVLWLRNLIARLYLNHDPSEMNDSPIFGGGSVASSRTVNRAPPRRP